MVKTCLFFSILFLLMACNSSSDDMRQLTDWMTGSFSSADQAAADSAFYDIRLEMIEIWHKRSDGPWIYVEQAVAEFKDEPYRQRIYHLKRQEDKNIASIVYELPEAKRFTGAWQNTDLLNSLTPDSLILRDGCVVILQREEKGGFSGSTTDDDCKSSLRGAAYATTQVQISADEIVSWDRGFDANGNQVWGAEKGGYIFKKIKNYPR